MPKTSPAMRLTQSLVLVALLLLAGACGQTPATQPTAPPAPPTTAPAEPTAAPPDATPTAAPTEAAAVEPTAAPAATTPAEPAAEVLPAPLYFLDQGQIWRLERDGQTRRQITFESSEVVDFDIAPASNALVYLIGAPEQRTIVVLDASGRTELMHGPVGSPRIHPSGERIAFEVMQPIDGLQIGREQGSDTGVFVQERTGGRPSVFQASDPIPDPNSPPDDAKQFFPHAWSPDGTRLLMGVFFPVGEGGWLAVKDSEGGPLVEITDGCCEPAWSVDGSAVTIAGGIYLQDASLGLWRADPATGATEQLIAPQENQFPLITAARQLSDGNIYAFLTITDNPPIEGRIDLTMQRVAPDGTPTPLRQDSQVLDSALWAEDASGAVIGEVTADAAVVAGKLSWLPADGSPAVRLGADGNFPRWGGNDAQPAAQACDIYTTIAWQAPGERQARPEVVDIQRRLPTLGYTDIGAADGLFGDQTRAVVSAFQRDRGLPQTGEVDCATWQAMLEGWPTP